MYHATTLTPPTSRDVRACGRDKVIYSASGRLVEIATHRLIFRARRTTFAQHTVQIPPTARPGIISPHFAQAWLGPSGHGASEFGCRSTASQIPGPHVVGNDRGLDRPPQPPPGVALPHPITHPPPPDHLLPRLRH